MSDLEIKQVLVYRRDLKMRKGKIAAQCAHASMKVFFDRGAILPPAVARQSTLSVPLTPEMEAWVSGLFGKIVLTVESEEDLLRAKELADAAGLPTALVTDAGRTEFHGAPTNTCIAIGPANAGEIDKITGPEGVIKTKLP